LPAWGRAARCGEERRAKGAIITVDSHGLTAVVEVAKKLNDHG